jgi:phosphohistidine phosphatase
MNLYLMRHGLAEDHAPSDRERRLTRSGIERMRAQAFGMKRLGFGFDRLLSSDYYRSSETARIIGDVLRIDVELEPRLGCGCEPDDLEHIVKELRYPDRLLVVGHQPDIGEFVRYLTGAFVAVDKGTFIHLETARLRRNDGMIREVLSPDTLVRSGEEGLQERKNP